MSIPVEVMKPEGEGPFPAVVMLHDCSGLGPRSSGAPKRWGRLLVSEGYVVVIPDSFTTRGHAPGVCTNPAPNRQDVRPMVRTRDAYEALAYARALPYVDPKRIGLMGGSHGGASTLLTLGVPRAEGAPRFAAAISLYPSCNPANPYRPTAPLLILTGELDDWTPAEPCRKLAEKATAAGHAVSIKVYPGAHHSFDGNAPIRYVEARVNGNSPTGRGATTGGNAEAWADSIREVKAFFARHLAAPRG
jgi:dienelactone hydrolase